jgi:hypothetical protein
MVKIYTISDKRPDFITLQNKYFKRFIQDKAYEFIVCNNASSNSLSAEILKACEDDDLQCLEVDKDFTDPATACEVPTNSCIRKYIAHDASENISVIIDSDIFLFAPFSFQAYLASYDLAGIVQQREKRSLLNLRKKNLVYLWNALLIFKNSKIVFDDFDVSIIEGITDVGGRLYYYLKKHQPHLKWMKHTPDIEQEENIIFKEPLRDKYEENFGMQIIEDSFIHYYRGSNWNNDTNEYHTKKTTFLNEFLSFSEQAFPLDIRNAEAFNNISSHAQKHYNGIRNNRNITFKPNNTF